MTARLGPGAAGGALFALLHGSPQRALAGPDIGVECFALSLYNRGLVAAVEMGPLRE